MNTLPEQLKVNISLIRHTTVSVRYTYNQEIIEGLAASIKAKGVLVPLLVRPIWEAGKQGKGQTVYEVVAGEYRFHACEFLGTDIISQIPVVIRDMEYDEALEIALIENAKRTDMNDIEEAESYLKTLEFKLAMTTEMVIKLLNLMNNELKNHRSLGRIYNGERGGPELASQVKTIEETFMEVGRMNWRNFLANRVPLLVLPEHLKQALRDNTIRSRAAKQIATLPDVAEQHQILEDLKNKRLKLRDLWDLIKGKTGKVNRTNWARDITELDNKLRKNAYSPDVQNQIERALNQIKKRLAELKQL